MRPELSNLGAGLGFAVNERCTHPPLSGGGRHGDHQSVSEARKLGLKRLSCSWAVSDNVRTRICTIYKHKVLRLCVVGSSEMYWKRVNGLVARPTEPAKRINNPRRPSLCSRKRPVTKTSCHGAIHVDTSEH